VRGFLILQYVNTGGTRFSRQLDNNMYNNKRSSGSWQFKPGAAPVSHHPELAFVSWDGMGAWWRIVSQIVAKGEESDVGGLNKQTPRPHTAEQDTPR